MLRLEKWERRKLKKHLKGGTILLNCEPFNVILIFTIKCFLWIVRSLELF